MRVNIDSKLWSDPRAKRLSALCAFSMRETVGTLAAVWDVAYSARSELMRRDDLELAAETPSFAAHMVSSRLAAVTPDPDVLRLAGVEERIKFLRLQAERGRQGGLARSRKRSRGVANAKQTPSERLASGKRTLSQPLTHSPALSPSPAPAHALPEDHATSEENTSVALPKGRRASPIPDGWVPSRLEGNIRAEIEAKAAGVVLRAELESMRDWARSQGKTRKDWDAQWRNWLRESTRRARGRPTANPARTGISQTLLSIARGEAP